MNILNLTDIDRKCLLCYDDLIQRRSNRHNYVPYLSCSHCNLFSAYQNKYNKTILVQIVFNYKDSHFSLIIRESSLFDSVNLSVLDLDIGNEIKDVLNKEISNKKSLYLLDNNFAMVKRLIDLSYLQ